MRIFNAIVIGICFEFLPSALSPAHAADVSGKHECPSEEFGKDASYKLVGDTFFGWRTQSVTGDIDLNGHTLILNTGGGNHTVVSGAITGKGAFEWNGGGVPQVLPSVLTGDKPNTFSGTFTLTNGVLDLDKPPGVDAISGDLLIGGKGAAVVKLDKANQINPASNITLVGKDVSALDLQGHDQRIASLTLQAHGEIYMGETPASLVVGDSSSRPWDTTKTLTIFGYKPGKDKLVFGKDANGLAKTQVARIGFASPLGLGDGLFAAKINSDGQLVPDTLVKAINPPFDVSPQPCAERAKLYELPGLARLCGKDSPLKDGMTIDFFGDSITWQNGYVGAIDKAIKNGEGTKSLHVKLVNRGINGGGVLQIRDGAEGAGFPGNTPQKPFAQLIAADKADLAVVYIGINDVTWRNTAPEVFEKALRDIVASAASGKTRLVLATLSVHCEMPDGTNSDDKKIDQYAQITRTVAQDTGTTLVDLRRGYIAYLQNHNAQLRVDGTLYIKPMGVLTYDGIHPNQHGVKLLAEMIGDGICRAQTARK